MALYVCAVLDAVHVVCAKIVWKSLSDRRRCACLIIIEVKVK